MAVDRDRAPVDEVPALREMRRSGTIERVRVRRATGCTEPVVSWWRVLVGDGDDREARLDRFVEGQGDLRGRACPRSPLADGTVLIR